MSLSDKLKAGGTSLEVIRNPAKYIDFNKSSLKELEGLISEVGADKFRFDLKFSTNNGSVIIFVDTKNYDDLTQIFKNIEQVKAYLREINDFSQLRIVQQGRPGMTLEAFKLEWKKALISNNYEVFDVIWRNSNLRQNTFGSVGEDEAREIYIRIASGSSSTNSLFNIVKLSF